MHHGNRVLTERTVANDDVYLESNDSALCALTDFRREDAITVESESSIEDALADMNRLRVHALLVTRQEVGSFEQQVVGLITYCDIERRHPELALVKYESLQSLTAYDLYEMFQVTGLTHLLVIETHGDELGLARGLVSRATLAKRLRRALVTPLG